ncbi:oligopeptide ABC transporter substrate-binding protein [Periweissella cryptocerci]|uniref:Oligopeptide ABC transporter substrate-binding protein n=1 Tax=Periweissella cryptocerci TaxID=2506420 RepID=A0A4P6YUY9_9LACO|nr:ABC transporter substrate-binding protein [Periweissella cryptocerci]QBO36580.1 oligopeptide ABC transporter substrate-binding protein [Periweissella cryptocerci]
MIKKYLLSGIIIVAIVAGVFAVEYHPTKAHDQAADSNNIKLAYNNKTKAIKGGILQMGLVEDQPFAGIFLPEVTTRDDDVTLAQPLGVSIFKTDKTYKIIDGGAANLRLDAKTKTATITLRKNLKWSDGRSVTAKDLEYPYELVTSPAYQAQTYTEALANIVGMDAYHAGKAKTISGITFTNGQNGRVMQVAMKAMVPGLTQAGSGYLLSSVEPYHYLKAIKPNKLTGAPQVRQHPLSWGPYKIAKVMSGQSITYVRNPYYYGKPAKLAKLQMTSVTTATSAEALKAKKYDIMYGMPATAYPAVSKLKDYVQTGHESLALSSMYFNLGHFDAKQGINIQDRNTPLQNKNLRAAMGYALNLDEINKKFNYGLQMRANTTVPVAFKQFNDKSIKGFPLNLNKANQLLDQAGFKWDAKHEYRLTPAGKAFSLTYLAQNGSENSEVIAQDSIQQWKQIGVNVHLYHNRLADFNTWLDMAVSGTNQAWDITDGNATLSQEPSQAGMFGKGALYNLGHFTSPELTKLIKNIDSPKANNLKYRQAQFKAYQAYMTKEAVVIPKSFSMAWYPVNTRVTGFTTAADSYNNFANIGVSAEAIQ